MKTLTDLLNVFRAYFERLGENALPKGIVTFLATSITFLCGGISTALIAFFVVLTLDLITGVWAAHKRGDQIKSEVAKKGAVKIIVYFILIILGHSLELIGLPLTKSAALIYASLTEGKSILENLALISGNLPLIQHFNEILDKYSKRQGYNDEDDDFE